MLMKLALFKPDLARYARTPSAPVLSQLLALIIRKHRLRNAGHLRNVRHSKFLGKISLESVGSLQSHSHVAMDRRRPSRDRHRILWANALNLRFQSRRKPDPMGSRHFHLTLQIYRHPPWHVHLVYYCHLHLYLAHPEECHNIPTLSSRVFRVCWPPSRNKHHRLLCHSPWQYLDC